MMLRLFRAVYYTALHMRALQHFQLFSASMFDMQHSHIDACRASMPLQACLPLETHLQAS